MYSWLFFPDSYFLNFAVSVIRNMIVISEEGMQQPNLKMDIKLVRWVQILLNSLLHTESGILANLSD